MTKADSFATPLLVAILLATAAGSVVAAEDSPTLIIRQHRFEPAEIRIPAGKASILIVRNADATVEEFESHDLRIEKIIAGGKETKIRIPPLKPGHSPFVGEFHADTAKGVLIVE